MAKKQVKTITVSKPRKSRKVVVEKIKSARIKRGKRLNNGASAAVEQELACSVLDPFNCSSCVPDGSTNTGCFTVKQQYSLGTGTGGSCCGLILLPSVDSFSLGDNGSTAATITVGGSWTSASAAASITAQYASVRPISAGIRVEYTGNTQTDQGVILVGQVATGVPPSTFNGTNLGSASTLLSSYKTFPLRAGAQIIWRPEEFDDQAVFGRVTGSGGTSTATAPGIPYLLVAVFGATAATASLVQCEAVVNFEGQFKAQSFIPGGISNVHRMNTPAVVGWFEKAKNIYNRVEPYLPLVANLLSASGNPMGIAMGNGVNYALTSSRARRFV